MGTRHGVTREETTPLLGIEEIESTQVYPVIHWIRQDVIVSVFTLCRTSKLIRA